MEFNFKSSDGRQEIVQSKAFRLIFFAFLLLLINAGYLAAAKTATLFHYANIILHVVLGLALIVPLLTKVRYFMRTDALHGKTFGTTVGRLGYASMLLAFGTGIYLLVEGNPSSSNRSLYLHALAGYFAYMCLISSIRRAAYNISVENTYWKAGRLGLTVFVIAGMLPIVAMLYRSAFEDRYERIRNPEPPPSSYSENNSLGDASPFYPSAAETAHGQLLNIDFLTEPETCGRSGCHVDIMQQWETSVHRQPAVAKAWYRSSYSFVQEQAGAQVASLCAGCHAPATLFEGSASKPVELIAQSRSGQTGITCTTCHAISGVKSNLGNSAYIMERPAFYSWMASENRLLRSLSEFLIHIDPVQHRLQFSRRFLTEQSTNFCSTCHTLTLDAPLPVASPRPGLIDYDDFAYGNSNTLQDVKSFVAPGKAESCISCHMPEVDSTDPAATNGKVRSHTFRALTPVVSAIGAVAPPADSLRHYSRDQKLFVDIFALRRKSGKDKLATEPGGAGEQGGNATGYVPAAMYAPVDDVGVHLRPGELVAIDVLVVALDIPHAFPAGAPGAVQAWVEVQVRDENDHLLYATASPDSGDNGPSTPHFFGVEFIDTAGESITQAHGLGASTVRFANFLPAFASDLATIRFELPENAGNELRITAWLRYRRHQASLVDSSATNGSSNSPDQYAQTTAKRLLNSPVLTLAADHVAVPLVQVVPTPSRSGLVAADAPMRWNNYGIAKLRNGHHGRALRAFRKALALDQTYYDAFLNMARVYLLTEKPDSALAILDQAASIQAKETRATYLRALALKCLGEISQAKGLLNDLRNDYSRDRAIYNELAHIYYLEGNHSAVISRLRRIMRIAPDDPVAHFYQMHAYRRLKDPGNAALEEKLYNRFAHRLTGNKVTPQLAIDDPIQEWQVLPWTNYERRYVPPIAKENER